MEFKALSLLFLGFVVSAQLLLMIDLAAGEGAFLLVDKKAEFKKRGKAGSERVVVSLALHNAGSSTAYDVSLNDENWPSEVFGLASGNTSAAWDKLEAGGSLYHTFILESKAKTVYYSKPAVVKFRMAAKSSFQEALSTPLPPLDILSDKPNELKFDWLKELAIKYGPLASVLSLVGVFVYLLVAPASSKKYSKASKKRR